MTNVHILLNLFILNSKFISPNPALAHGPSLISLRPWTAVPNNNRGKWIFIFGPAMPVLIKKYWSDKYQGHSGMYWFWLNIAPDYRSDSPVMNSSTFLLIWMIPRNILFLFQPLSYIIFFLYSYLLLFQIS